MFSCGRYPSLRVAYIDEVEEVRDTKKGIYYYSSLVKAALPKSMNSSEPVPNLDQVSLYNFLELFCIIYISKRGSCYIWTFVFIFKFLFE